MTRLEHAIVALEQAVEMPRRPGRWRNLVRHRLTAVKEALMLEHTRPPDAWLAARQASLTRERDFLLAKLARLGPFVLEATDLDAAREELRRLVRDLEHHRQRLNDLVYDTVSLEIGGSE